MFLKQVSYTRQVNIYSENNNNNNNVKYYYNLK